MMIVCLCSLIRAPIRRRNIPRIEELLRTVNRRRYEWWTVGEQEGGDGRERGATTERNGEGVVGEEKERGNSAVGERRGVLGEGREVMVVERGRRKGGEGGREVVGRMSNDEVGGGFLVSVYRPSTGH